MFVGVLAYADGIALLTPTAHACGACCQSVKSMLQNFVFHLMLPNRNVLSARLVVCLRKGTLFVMSEHHFYNSSINGSAVEVMQSWPHLGHIISSDMDDTSDIDRCRHKLIGQINNVLCSFHQVDSIVKIGLLKSYCLSLYGCEMWLLQHFAIENICKSWRNSMRRVWGCHLTVDRLLYKF